MKERSLELRASKLKTARGTGGQQQNMNSLGMGGKVLASLVL